MPIKPFKGFARRRSSGNVLDSPETPPEQSSFRVLERPSLTHVHTFGHDAASKTFPAAADSTLPRPRSSPMQAQMDRRFAAPQEHSGYLSPDKDAAARSPHPDVARGSAHTFQSASSHNNTSRDSYASTEPSSVESFQAEPARAPAPTSASASPVQDSGSKHTFSLLSAARTFSFAKGSKKTEQLASPDRDPLPETPSQTRERGMTESSYTSTVVPPKLDLGSDMDFSSGFGDMFAKRKSTIWEEPSAVSLPPNNDPAAFEKPPLVATNSWESNGPEDRLMSAAEHSSKTKAGNSSFFADTDALMVMNAVSSGRFLNDTTNDRNPRPAASSTSPYESRSSPYQPKPQQGTIASQFARSAAPSTSMFAGRASLSADAERKADLDPDSELVFDPSKSARLAQLNIRRTTHKKQQPSKIMTPAEFDEYKRQKQTRQPDDDQASEHSDSDVNYDDEDETERNRTVTKQRRRQEAHLAVYRQQMMKVTGEPPSDLPPRPVMDRASHSAPNLLANRLSSQRPNGRSSDDEDEDIPLGVLQAHGFPSKGRPPSRLSPNGAGLPSRPATQLSSYPSPPGATRNDATAGGGGAIASSGNLPPFARNLPNDPYLGASLVSHTPRESMAFGGGAPPPQPHVMPPGGLVGVIAGEERARAARRGSPNSRGVYDAVPTPQPTGFMQQPQMPMPMMTPGEQAQMQTAAQMQQMMQMQMQWMQQMMQMQGVQMPPPPFMTGMEQQRPMSAGSQQRHVSQMSFNGPNMNMGHLNVPGSSQSLYGMPGPSAGYAPSIAPSERSNVGQPSRYRPVSAIHVDHSRSSSMSQHQRSSSRLTMTDINGQTRTTVRAVEKPKKPVHVSDDEDEEGWAEMKKKKQERKSRWRQQKPSMTEQAAHGHEGLEGIYYDG